MTQQPKCSPKQFCGELPLSPTNPDRVFVRSINTIRTLSSRPGYSSRPRPPIESRIQLYGMYKQATEGDVVGVMARPTGNSEIDVAGQKKWDAWKQQEGLSKTEAKRRYVSYLISLMGTHASDTHEGRELLAELEYMWDQIKDVASDSEGADEELYEDAVEYPARSTSRGEQMAATTHSHVSHTASHTTQGGRSQGGRSHVSQSLSQVAPHPQSRSSSHTSAAPHIQSDRFKNDMAWALRTINEEMADMAKQYRPADPSEPRGGWRKKAVALLRGIGVHVGIDLVIFAVVTAILKTRNRRRLAGVAGGAAGAAAGAVTTGPPDFRPLASSALSLSSLSEHMAYHFVQLADGVYGYAVTWFSMK